MRKSQADTPLGGLLNRSLLPEDYGGESRQFLNVEPKGENPFDLLNWLVSEFVVNGKKLHFGSYSKVFFDCAETVKHRPKENTKKRTLFMFLSKYPMDVVLSDPELIKETLRNYDQKVSRILFSKRALGSDKFQRLRDQFQLVLVRKPGKTAFPHERYIGVGYRDKGSSREKSHSGTPSWQEVATLGSSELVKKETVHPDRFHLLDLRGDGHLGWKQQKRLRKLRRQRFSLLD